MYNVHMLVVQIRCIFFCRFHAELCDQARRHGSRVPFGTREDVSGTITFVVSVLYKL